MMNVIDCTVLTDTVIKSTNLNEGKVAYNVAFHTVQIAALLTFYVVSNMDPGIIGMDYPLRPLCVWPLPVICRAIYP